MLGANMTLPAAPIVAPKFAHITRIWLVVGVNALMVTLQSFGMRRLVLTLRHRARECLLFVVDFHVFGDVGLAGGVIVA